MKYNKSDFNTFNTFFQCWSFNVLMICEMNRPTFYFSVLHNIISGKRLLWLMHINLKLGQVYLITVKGWFLFLILITNLDLKPWPVFIGILIYTLQTNELSLMFIFLILNKTNKFQLFFKISETLHLFHSPACLCAHVQLTCI